MKLTNAVSSDVTAVSSGAKANNNYGVVYENEQFSNKEGK